MKFKKMISMSPKQFLLVLIPMLLVGVFVSFSFNNVTATLIKRNVIERVKAFV